MTRTEIEITNQQSLLWRIEFWVCRRPKPSQKYQKNEKYKNSQENKYFLLCGWPSLTRRMTQEGSADLKNCD